MDTPTFAIESHPGLERPVHPIRWGRVWVIEILLFLVCFGFYSEAPAWTMWREGTRITGPIVTVKDSGNNHEWVTVRDPATELVYQAFMWHRDYDVGERATVIVHPTDPSKVLTPTNVYLGVAVQCALLVLTIAYPITAVVRHRRSRGRLVIQPPAAARA